MPLSGDGRCPLSINNDRQEELDSTVDLAAERKLVRRIIQRLVSIDKVLFVVTTATHVTERGVDS
eukprot:486942-Prymnesium_polylepis.1